MGAPMAWPQSVVCICESTRICIVKSGRAVHGVRSGRAVHGVKSGRAVHGVRSDRAVHGVKSESENSESEKVLKYEV